jgi:hypothetical protein
MVSESGNQYGRVEKKLVLYTKHLKKEGFMSTKNLSLGMVVVVFLIASSAFQVLADSPEGTMLLDEDFEKNDIGAKPAKWYVHVDDEKEVSIVGSPAIGNRAVRLNDTGPTVWKPMISAGVSGESDSYLKLDFDWYIEKPFKGDTVFSANMRGKGNISIVAILIRGNGGISVKQKGLGFVPLNIPLKLGQWNHLTIITEPISKKETGVFSIVVKQGQEKSEFKNLQFYPPEKWQGEFPDAWDHTPYFNLTSKAAGSEGEVYIDNVKLQVIPPGRVLDGGSTE